MKGCSAFSREGLRGSNHELAKSILYQRVLTGRRLGADFGLFNALIYGKQAWRVAAAHTLVANPKTSLTNATHGGISRNDIPNDWFSTSSHAVPLRCRLARQGAVVLACGRRAERGLR